MSEKTSPGTSTGTTPSVERWDPFRELDLFRGWPSPRLLGEADARGLSATPRWSPSMDVSETDTHFIATVELAGAKKEDVHVEVEQGMLTIRGEKRSEREEEDEHIARSACARA